MARKKNRMGILKRQREQRKAEKREEKRLRRIQRKELAEAGDPESEGDLPEGEPAEGEVAQDDDSGTSRRDESREVLDEAE